MQKKIDLCKEFVIVLCAKGDSERETVRLRDRFKEIVTVLRAVMKETVRERETVCIQEIKKL